MGARGWPFWAELGGALVAALLVSNAATFWFLSADREAAVRGVRVRAAQEQIIELARLAAAAPEPAVEAALRLVRGPRVRLEVETRPRVEASEAPPRLVRRFERALSTAGLSDVRVRVRPAAPLAQPRLGDGLAAGWGRWDEPTRETRGLRIERFSASARLPDGRWINADYVLPAPPRADEPLILSAIVGALALFGVAVFMSLRVVGPLQALAGQAQAMRAGQPAAPVPERGPAALRAAAAAFNAMARQVEATLASQRALLAGLAHDLRTPLTALRLRLEFVEDAQTRARMSASLAELEALTQAALEAARAGGEGEPLRLVDVTALAEAVCADLGELGTAAAFSPSAPAPARVRPAALRRALRNLIENAARYGGGARVRVEAGEGRLCVVVEDEGPGIPEDMVERVFDPFVRLEGSRSLETGGHGLGLTIARLIARSHGGDVVLENRPSGGVKAVLSLPSSRGA
jgi:signal transduction histidine kinase